jgi:hypothetical protein
MAPIFRFEDGYNFKKRWKSKNQRSRITRHSTHEESGIKARAIARAQGAGSPAENSKENEFPFRTG